MKVAILCQEEPVFLGPMIGQIMRMHPDGVAAVFLAGRRSAGEHRRTWVQRLESLWVFWRIFELAGFAAATAVRLRARLLGRWDPYSIAATAGRLGIAVHHVGDPNGQDFCDLLARVQPDVVFNQSERILRKEVLSIPRCGFLNRHGSLLPAYRGRLASFWSHAAQSPRYGLTFHQVDEGLDTGPIVLQRELGDIDPTWPYPKVMRCLCQAAPELFWKAVDQLGGNDQLSPQPETTDTHAHVFPSLADVRRYREMMNLRRVKQRR